jgi:hypothetical protein
MDEMLGLSLNGKFKAYVGKNTTDGAARPGAEHNHRATVVLTLGLVGTVMLVHIITANSTPNVLIPEELDGKPLLWGSTANGYIDAAFMMTYARRLRRQVGHNRVILLLMDGFRAHITPEVLALFSSLAILVFILPPHTSHGLAPCDQFNFIIHKLRAKHEHAFFTQGMVYNNVNLRLIALGNAVVDCYSKQDLVVAAWRRAGISHAKIGVELLGNQPRKAIAALSPQAAPAVPATAAACMAEPRQDASPEELRRQIAQLQELVAGRKAEVHAAQEAVVGARLKHSTDQLNARGKARVSVRPSLMGDVTDENFKTAIAEAKARKEVQKAKKAKKEAQSSYEQPLVDKLVADGVIGQGSKLIVTFLRQTLKDLDLPSSGHRRVLIKRLADYHEVELAQPAADDTQAASPAAAAEESDVEMADFDDGEGGEAEHHGSPGDHVQLAEADVVHAAEQLAAMSEVDQAAIQTLLAERTESMKNHYDWQCKAARDAARRREELAAEA